MITMEEKVEQLAEELREKSYREMVRRADRTVNPDKVYSMWYQQNPMESFREKARKLLAEDPMAYTCINDCNIWCMGKDVCGNCIE